MAKVPLNFGVPPNRIVDCRFKWHNNDQNNKSRKNSIHCSFSLLRKQKKTTAQKKKKLNKDKFLMA